MAQVAVDRLYFFVAHFKQSFGRFDGFHPEKGFRGARWVWRVWFKFSTSEVEHLSIANMTLGM
jgi:hypothetical protein